MKNRPTFWSNLGEHRPSLRIPSMLAGSGQSECQRPGKIVASAPVHPHVRHVFLVDFELELPRNRHRSAFTSADAPNLFLLAAQFGFNFPHGKFAVFAEQLHHSARAHSRQVATESADPFGFPLGLELHAQQTMEESGFRRRDRFQVTERISRLLRQ